MSHAPPLSTYADYAHMLEKVAYLKVIVSRHMGDDGKKVDDYMTFPVLVHQLRRQNKRIMAKVTAWGGQGRAWIDAERLIDRLPEPP